MLGANRPDQEGTGTESFGRMDVLNFGLDFLGDEEWVNFRELHSIIVLDDDEGWSGLHRGPLGLEHPEVPRRGLWNRGPLPCKAPTAG